MDVSAVPVIAPTCVMAALVVLIVTSVRVPVMLARAYMVFVSLVELYEIAMLVTVWLRSPTYVAAPVVVLIVIRTDFRVSVDQSW